MKQEDLMYLFLSYCDKNSLTDVKRLLSKHYKDIDLTYSNGEAFIAAGRNSSIDLMKLLLNHYNSTQLQGNARSDKYQDAYTIIQNILVDVQSQCEISEKMQAIFDSYHIYKIEEPSNIQDTNSSADSRNDKKIFLSDEQIDEFEDHIDTSVSASPKLIGEQEINNTLLLTTDNLVAKSYRYMVLNTEAVKSFENNDSACLIDITDAATLITSNNNKTANIEYKSTVLYNYLKFHQKFTGTIPNDTLGLTVINQIEEFFKEQVIFIAIRDANSEVLNIFLSNHGFADISDQHGQTPLHWASDDPEITRMLLSTMSHQDILKQAEDNNYYTALHIAVHHKNNDVVDLLLNKAPELASIQDKFGQTPLHWASDNPKITEPLLNAENSLRQSSSTAESIAGRDSIFHDNHDNVELVGLEHHNYPSSQNDGF